MTRTKKDAPKRPFAVKAEKSGRYTDYFVVDANGVHQHLGAMIDRESAEAYAKILNK